MDNLIGSIGILLGCFLIYTGYWKSFYRVNMGIVCLLLSLQILLGYDYHKIIMTLLLLPVGILIAKWAKKDPTIT